jgi:F420-dependent oxidoreductase-like protein
MRFGVQTIPQFTPWPPLPEIWARIEALGYDSLWLSDHFTSTGGDDREAWGPVFEALTTGAALATLTRRVRIGHLVLANSFRHPALLASAAATLDHISGGRFILGMGTGWHELEHRAFGIPLGAPGERIRRLEESLEVITRLWTEDRVTFEGRYIQLQGAQLAPKPLQKPHPPIMLGGDGERGTLRLVARYAQAWNSNRSAATTARKRAVLADHCAKYGRDPSEIEVSARVLEVILTEDRAAAEARVAWHVRKWAGFGGDAEEIRGQLLVGSADAIRDQVAAFAAAGVHQLLIPANPFDERTNERLERFATEIIPRLRDL